MAAAPATATLVERWSAHDNPGGSLASGRDGFAQGSPTSFAAHLHGRGLVVARTEAGRWRWRVVSPHGALLAAGDAPSRLAAERAAEDEATAVHPPTRDLLDQLLS